MKGILKLLILTTAFFISCNNEDVEKDINKENVTKTQLYDSVLAEKYGADEYGMKKYVMAFLKKGPNRDLDSVSKAELQNAHMENIDKMAEEGKLVLAGSFFGKGDIRGIYIFNVESIREAEELTNSDPAIKAGSLIMELFEWYGSAALMGLNEEHKKIQEISITE